MAQRYVKSITAGLVALIVAFAIDQSWYVRAHVANTFSDSSWPLESGLRYHFVREEKHFLVLTETMAQNSDYTHIYSGGGLFKEPCIVTSSGSGCPATLDERLRSSIRESGVFAVARHGDTLLFGLEAKCSGNALITFGFANVEKGSDIYPLCPASPAFKGVELCLIPIRGDWYLNYETEINPDACQ